MPFKPDLFADPPVALPGFGVIAVEGADSAAFLQAQTMNDVLALAPGHWHWNGWLTPKGRLVALFALLRLAPDRFRILLPDLPAEDLCSALQRYVFRSKVKLAVEPAWTAAAGPAHPRASGAAIGGDEATGLALDFSGDALSRTLWLLPAGTSTGQPPDTATADAWRNADIAHGLPRLGPLQREAWTPQMLSLERLGAYSLRKGCYPGQEIVARTHYLGQSRRGLVRLQGDGLVEGLSVDAEGRASGTVICVTAEGDDALAVLVADAPESLNVAGRPVRTALLNGGLSR